jgi:protein-L-isoaspartate(D-aspartate) O-methyltransferase
MDYNAARHNMVESQIRPNRVTDPLVMSAMAEVPREAFLPKALRGVAYVDEDISLGNGRHLMEPLVLARLLQGAEIEPSDVVLVIGCATGYCSAVLARMANTVVALESDPSLAEAATATLGEQGIDTVAFVEGALRDGYAKQGPYDVIFFCGAVPEIPPTIRDQLSEGGRMVAVISEGPMGKAVLVTRRDGLFSSLEKFDAAIPMLPGFETEPSFVF